MVPAKGLYLWRWRLFGGKVSNFIERKCNDILGIDSENMYAENIKKK